MKKIINHNTLLKIILKEGRNRQIPRIKLILGYQVQDLQRIATSNIKLNGLQAEQWREPKTNEWISLLNKNI